MSLRETVIQIFSRSPEQASGTHPQPNMDELLHTREQLRQVLHQPASDKAVVVPMLIEIETEIGFIVFDRVHEENDPAKAAQTMLIEELGFREDLAMATINNLLADQEQEKRRYYGY